MVKIYLAQSVLTLFKLSLIISQIKDYNSVTAELTKNISTGEQDLIEVSVFSNSEVSAFNHILYSEQNRRVRSKLLQENYQNIANGTAVLSRDLANGVVDYLLQHKDNEEKITELAALLLQPLGEYGSEIGENITITQKMSVIHNWLRRSVLGMSFIDWIINEVSNIKMEGDNSLLMHGNLKRRFFNQLNSNTSLGSLTYAARIYYQEHLIIEDMPSFLPQVISEQEQKRLQSMSLCEYEFSYLYIGLKAISESYNNSKSFMSLDEIEDLGGLIEYLYRNGNVEFISLFELPAKIYYLSTLDNKVLLPREIWSTYYEEYFDYLKTNNFLIQLMEPMNNWKDRPTLARQLFETNDIPEDVFLTDYLNRGNNSDGMYRNRKNELVYLPSIDHIFDEQNKKVFTSFKELEKLRLLLILNLLDKENYEFIQTAEINVVEALFFDKNIPMPAYNSLEFFKVSIKLQAVDLDLLQCIGNNNEHRVYVLDMTNNKLHRVDNNRSMIFSYYKHDDPGSTYELEFVKSYPVKKSEEPIEKIFNKLSEKHGDKFYNDLKIAGYKATFSQKFFDFFLNILPFYSCVNELNNKNPSAAVLPCSLDILSLVSLAGHGIRAAYRFGTASVKASIDVLPLIARRASIYQILQQASKSFVNGGLKQVQKTINSRVISSLGREFLRSVDPGIGLLRLGGIQGIKAIEKATNLMKNRFSKLDEVAKRLVSRAEIELSQSNLISTDILKTKRTILLPGEEREVTVVKIGSKNGEDILISVDAETNIPYGRKLLFDQKTGRIELAPITIRERIYRLKNYGLNGDHVIVAKTWKNWETQSTSLTTPIRATSVYCVDTRDPQYILDSVKGIYPRSRQHNYNLDTINIYYKNYADVNQAATSSFILTSSRLSESRYSSKLLAAAVESFIYEQYGEPLSQLPNDLIAYVWHVKPDSNFYNVYESFLASRDVCRPNSARYETLDKIIDRSDVNIYAALNGFNRDRIMRYAAIRRNDDGNSPLAWVENPYYNKQFENDLSASDLYTNVAIYKAEDAFDMAVDIVQQTRNVNKNQAKQLLLFNFQSQEITDMVTKYNTPAREEYLNKIRNLVMLPEPTPNDDIIVVPRE